MSVRDAQIRWLNAFYLDLSREVSQNLGMLLGKQVRLQEENCEALAPAELLSRIVPPALFSIIKLESGYSGQACLAFAKKDAVLLGGLLSMLGEEALAERLESLTFEPSDRDAFQEICNQLIGYADRVLIERLPQRVHLKQKGTETWNEGEPPLEFEDITYLMPIHALIGDRYEVEFYYLFPESVVNQFALTEKQARSGPKGSASPRRSSVPAEVPKVVFIPLQESDGELEHLVREMAVSYRRIGRLSALGEILQAGRPKLIVFEGDGRLESVLSAVGRLKNLLYRIGIPFWISGSGWTRELVHRAAELGADYLVAFPLDSERVRQKLRQTLALREG